jgi:hypothetical protein
VDAPTAAAPGAPPALETHEVVGPARVVQAAEPHLCFDVPAGWTGLLTQGTTFLTLSHPEGYRVALSVDAGGGFSPARPGHHLVFEDAGTYRHPPLLPDAGTRSWAADDPLGTYLRAWYGTVRGVPVEVLLEYPLGKVTAGEAVFEPLLARWCTAPR